MTKRWLVLLMMVLFSLAFILSWALAPPLVYGLPQATATHAWGPVASRTPAGGSDPGTGIPLTQLPSNEAIDQTLQEVSAADLELSPVSQEALAESIAQPAYDGTLRRIAVPILMYHYISVPPEDADEYRLDLSVSPENFRAQLQYLAANGYNTISLYELDDALRWGTLLPPNPVVLTFDDGYIDAYQNAFPILQESGFTGTFFVITQRLDERHPDYMSWEQAREMFEAGMSIESHTKDHPDLRGRDFDFLYYQILGSIESIEAHTGHRPQMFCFPAGRWDVTVMNTLDDFGVRLAVTTAGGVEHTTDLPYILRRVRVSGDTDLAMFATLLEWSWDRAD